jgi:hypothetical protein
MQRHLDQSKARGTNFTKRRREQERKEPVGNILSGVKSMIICVIIEVSIAYRTKIARSEGQTQARSGSPRIKRVDGRLVTLELVPSCFVLLLACLRIVRL